MSASPLIPTIEVVTSVMSVIGPESPWKLGLHRALHMNALVRSRSNLHPMPFKDWHQ